ncbi:MAG: ABC transporter ATP-binding protein [Firmicutes bacterium]|nr:ABC transporter ATP-binding protein [Bacillota bacterium]
MAFFEIKNLTKTFGGLVAIDNFSIEMEKGELVGLIGPNGAGKTTVFNVVNGIYKPTSGKVILEGNEIHGKKPFEIAERGIGRTFQNIRLFSNLSVVENVRIACHRQVDYGLFHSLFRTGKCKAQDAQLMKTAADLLDLVGLADRRDELAKNLPYGHQRRLEIARALATRPKFLLLDEPAAGMNPQESDDLSEFVVKIRKMFGLTILLIEHHMDVVMDICERMYVLNFGKTIAAGDPASIQSNREVIEAYLGEEEESA